MIQRLVTFALHQPLFFMMMAALFVAGGVAAFLQLPVEAFPDVSDTQVNVIALYPGRAPEEVEKQVTIPLEVALNGLPHQVRLFSHTQFGLAFMMLTFDDHANDAFARQQVGERLRSADLPAGVTAEIAPLSTAIGEILRYRVVGAGYSPRELRTFEDWTVERQLRLVPGVADVVGMGGSIKSYEVAPDLGRMQARGVSLQQLAAALARGNANVGGGKVDQGAQQYLIRGLGMLRSTGDIENVVVAAHEGTPVLVKDVASVAVGSVPREGVVGQDDDDDAVIGIVVMRKGENPSEVLAGVKARIELLNSSLLPAGVRVVPFYDRSWLIETTLATVFENLAEGAGLVVIVLFLFLGNLRAAAIVAAVIPLSLLATFVGLTWRGIPANLLSLGAMDFGIIVDGAVIVVENVFRRLSERDHATDRAAVRRLVLDATAEVGRPTFFSLLIIIAAHIPIFTLQRHEGRIFAPMAWTVTSALVGSLLLSLTLVPLLCFFLLRRNVAHGDNLIVRAAKRLYRTPLQWALRHRVVVLGAAVLALAASLALVPRLGSEFLPELNEGSTWVNVTLPPGLSLREASSLCHRLREACHRVPEVAGVVSKAGRPEDGTDPKTLNMAEMLVDMKPAAQWRAGVTKDDVLAQIQHEFDALPGIETSFSQPIRDNVLESISQIDGQVVIKVFGEDSAVLHTQAEAVLGQVRGVQGVARAFIDRAGEVPQAMVEVDRARAARYGLNVADVEDLVESGLGGKAVSELWEGEKHFDVVIRLPACERGLDRFARLLVDTPDGQRVPLGEVASFKIGSGSMNISRENGTRVAAVSVFIAGRDMGSVVADMQQRVSTITMPPGCRVTWSGEFENQQRAMQRLMVIVPLSVFLIFVLLFDAFRAVRSAVLILLNVPFALVGGILALLVTGIPLSVSAAIGFIALFGQAVLNGVVMVNCFNDLCAQGRSPRDAVIEGSLLRLRTVLMTAMLAMLGLLPMALSHAIGSETQKPLAVVIIGGLVSATLLTLFVLPTLYLVGAPSPADAGTARHPAEGTGEVPAAPLAPPAGPPAGPPVG